MQSPFFFAIQIDYSLIVNILIIFFFDEDRKTTLPSIFIDKTMHKTRKIFYLKSKVRGKKWLNHVSKAMFCEQKNV